MIRFETQDKRAAGATLLLALMAAVIFTSCAAGGDSAPGSQDMAATESTIDAAEDLGTGIPFGPSKLPFEEMGGIFTGTKLNPSPNVILEDLQKARSAGARVFLVLVGAQSNYTNPDGSFNLEDWKARVDRFKDLDFTEFIEDGTVIAHQLIDEAKARGQWDGTVITNDVIDEMARYSKQLFPTMRTVLRVEPTLLEEHAGGYDVTLPDFGWQHLDAAWAPYLVRKGSVAEYAEDQQTSADRQGLGLVLELNAYDGGDGSSGLRSPIRDDKWVMSADELVEYGTALLQGTRGCALILWRYETPGTEFEDVVYFRRPDVQGAMEELSNVAARVPSYPCFVSR
jgi:hypothetical protein